jgi:hypothetical protein
MLYNWEPSDFALPVSHKKRDVASLRQSVVSQSRTSCQKNMQLIWPDGNNFGFESESDLWTMMEKKVANEKRIILKENMKIFKHQHMPTA